MKAKFLLIYLIFIYNFFYLKVLSDQTKEIESIKEKIASPLKKQKDNFIIKWEKIEIKNDAENQENKRFNIKWEKEKIGIKQEIFKSNFEKFKDLDYRRQINIPMLSIGKAVPTSNTLNTGDYQITFSQIAPIKSAYYGGGTGNQNYFGSIDYGVNENLTISGFYSHSDDPLHRQMKKSSYPIANRWSSAGLMFRWKKFNKENYKLAIDTSIESWDVKSGGCNTYKCDSTTKNIFNSSNKAVNNTNIIGSFSVPFTWILNKNTEISFVPRAIFLPSSQGNENGSGEFYGINTGFGIGIVHNPFQKIKTFNSIYFPIGSGNNSFNTNLVFQKEIIFTSGINFSLDTKTAFEGYLTNAFGESPSTSILALPSSNELIFGARVIYRPTNYDWSNINEEEKFSNYQLGGLSVANAYTINNGKSRIKGGIDSESTWWYRYDWGASKLFNIDLSLNSISQNSTTNNLFNGKYHDLNEIILRGGGTAKIFSQDRGDLITTSLRISAGRSRGWGWLFGELINTYKINNNLSFNINPKISLSGIANPSALGISLNSKILPGVYFIPETNISISESETNWTLALRFFPLENKFFEIYTTNSLSFIDTGQLMRSNKNSYGLNIGLIF